MIPTDQIPTAELRCSTTEHIGASEVSSEPRLRVTVVFTTLDGTLAALTTAGILAQDLGARVSLVVTEEVPLFFPLEDPPVAIPFLERRQIALVSAAGIEAEEVRIEIYLCRDRKECLRRALSPHSLVLIGGERDWWFSRERRLEQFLRALGHHVVFVEREAKNHAGPVLRSYLHPVFRRVLDLYQDL